MQSLNPKTWRAAAANRLEPLRRTLTRDREELLWRAQGGGEREGDLRGWSVGGGERRPRVVAAHGTIDGGEASRDEP